MRSVQAGPATGAVAQVGLLALLAATVGLTAAGWAVGLACGATTDLLLLRGLRRSGAAELGRPNAITLLRATLAGGVAALVASALAAPAADAPGTTVVVGLAAVGLALDAVDGWTARRTGTATALGARFDGEVDAFLILVLSVLAARSLGPWVLTTGLLRYAFLVAGVLPWMRRPLPRRDWRKTVAAVTGIGLVVAVAGVLPEAWARLAVAVPLVLLLESFGRDVWWLWRRRRAADPAPRSHRARRAPARLPRLVVARTAGVVAVLLLWAALVLPDGPSGVAPGALLRIPVEGLAVVAVAVVLPARARTLLAVLVGLALTGLSVLRALDLGFVRTVDRPFNAVSDWQLLDPALGVVSDSSGLSRATLLAAAGAVLVVLLVALTASALCVLRLAARHRGRTLQGVTVLGLVWGLCAATAVTTPGGAPVAASSATGLISAQVQLVRAGLRDQRTFAAAVAAPDRFAEQAAPAAPAVQPGPAAPAAPAVPRLLSGLRGKDVLVVFVESYGRVSLEGPAAVAQPVSALLDEATAALRADGVHARSGFLTSPVFGGGSWLAHATLQSGLWIDSQARYDALLRSGRMTLTAAFGQAGWRTVVDIPSSPSPWPEGQALHGFDVMYGTQDVGYTGPAFSYAQVPDQYTLHALHQRELAARPRRPVMAEVDLVSSHAPWAPLPRLVPWQELGDGAVFEAMEREGRRPADVLGSAERRTAAYAESLVYSLGSLVSYVRTFPDPDRVLVLLGDHQPTNDVPGSDASRDVPITVVAQDPAVLQRIAAWGWDDGMRPASDAPVWRMDEFRDRFLSAFASPSGQAPAAGSPERE